MNNKRVFLKASLTLLITAILIAAAAVCVWAVPADPDSGYTGKAAACRSHAGSIVTLDEIPARQGVPCCAPSLDPVQRDIPLLTIVIGFSNISYRNDWDWNDRMFTGDRSLSAYYSDMSFGKFTFTPAPETSVYGAGGNTNTEDRVNDGVVHVSLDTPHKDWANENEYPAQAQAMIAAINAADDYVDFASFDADSNGRITENELAVGFVFAGYEASATTSYSLGVEKYLWAHAWTIADIIGAYNLSLSLPAPDGIQVSAYISIAEQIEEGKIEPINILAHELGHYLGLPDLYDTSYNTRLKWGKYDVSDLSLMANGCWGVDPDGTYIPYSLDVWSRYALGWCTPLEAKTDGDYTVAAQDYSDASAFKALYLPTQRENEYYLLENRQFTKWDAGLASDFGSSGIIVWHIDDDVFEQYYDDNQVNDTIHRPAVMPIFPEQLNGEYTFIGATDRVLVTKPFFSSSSWEALFPTSEAPLDLPLYGEGTNANQRGSRILSGIKLRFPTASAAAMTVRLYTDDHFHLLKEVERVEPHCATPGTVAHWACTYCEACFADAEGNEPLSAEQLAIAAPGHAFGEPQWSWAADYTYATAVFSCGNCTETQTLCDRNPSKAEISAATPNADQVVVLTANVTLNGQAYQTSTDPVSVPGTADQAAANEVKALINAIGTIEYTAESKAKIEAARAAYEALSESRKQLVDNLSKLTAAEKRFCDLEAAASQPGQPDDPSGDLCPLDGVDHGTSLMGRIIRFFHNIRWFFINLFGKA